MSRLPTRRSVRARALLLLGAAAALGSAAVIAAPLSAPAAADSGSADRAAAYLVSQLTDGDHYESGGFVQYGTTVDIALGLAAAGAEPDALAEIVDFLDEPETVDAYTHGVPFDRDDAVYAGPTAKLATTASLLGMDPRDVGGEDLIANLAALERPDGRFSDISDFGDFSNVIGQSFAVLALTAATGQQPDDAAIDFLLGTQCDDGGFPIDIPKNGACQSSPDATGLAIQALDGADPVEGPEELGDVRLVALTAAVRWLESSRSADGYWEAFDAPNVNSTGYAAMALIAVGQDPAASIAWLESVQHDDGGLPIAPGDPDSDVFATAQALEALAGSSFLTMNPEVLGAVVEVPSGPTTTPTETVTETATPTETTTASPTASETLPPTGAGKTGTLIGIGALLAVLGGALVIAGRRLRGRP
jgi:hypothetical protein